MRACRRAASSSLRRAPGQAIPTRIDRLRRQLFPHIVRIRASEPSGTLLRRTPLRPMRPHVLPPPRVEKLPWSSRVLRTSGGVTLRRTRPIGRPQVVFRVPSRLTGLGHVPTSAPSFGANGPGSRSHGLRHSGVCTILFAWQHQSPSGLVVLHLELELKPGYPGSDLNGLLLLFQGIVLFLPSSLDHPGQAQQADSSAVIIGASQTVSSRKPNRKIIGVFSSIVPAS